MTDLFEIFESRVLNQFTGSTNLMALFEDIYTQVQDVQDVFESLRDERYIDTAEGAWLDICGLIVGLDRPYADEDPDLIFTVKDVGEASVASKGVYDAGPPATGGYIQSVEGIGVQSDPSTMISDADFRRMIKAKAIAQNVGGTVSDLWTYLRNGFGVESTITIDQAGRALVELDSYLSQKERYHITTQGPLPAGIDIHFTNWPEP